MKLYEKYLGESEKRWVHGSRDNKWHLVGKDDRDFYKGITQKEFKKLTKKQAMEKYYGRASFIGAKNENINETTGGNGKDEFIQWLKDNHGKRVTCIISNGGIIVAAESGKLRKEAMGTFKVLGKSGDINMPFPAYSADNTKTMSGYKDGWVLYIKSVRLEYSIGLL